MKKFPLSPLAKLYLGWLIFIFFSTEVLSYFQIISRPSIIIANLIFFALYIFQSRKDFGKFKLTFSINNKFNLVIYFILVLIFIQGFFSAPNTTDSMTYHITRVMYWIQERTVNQDFIRSTHDFMAPFGEYIFMHLYLLTGNDRLLFFSSWLSFATVIYLSGVLAFRIGADKKQVNLVRVFTATIPIAVLQASSTQVDLITNVITLFGLYFVFNLIERATIKDSLILAVIVGMGLLVKAPFVFHIFIPLALLGLFKLTRLKKEVYIFLMIILVSVLMQRHYLHNNVNLYENFFGQSLTGEQNRYVNQRFDASALFSNVIRNTINQFPIPVFAPVAERLLGQLLSLIGTDIQDPLTTYPQHEFHVLPVIFPQEDIASSPIHLILILLAAVFLYKNRKRIKNYKIVGGILVLVIVSYTFFAYVLKYEPYHPRLQIPYFMIGTIAAIQVLFSYKWGHRLLTLMLVPSVVLAFALILLNVLRPFIPYSVFYNHIKGFAPANSAAPEAFFMKPREMQYFNARPYLYSPYKNVVNLIALSPGKKHIVLKLSDDEFEYPLWALLKSKKVDFYIQQNKFVENPIPKDALIVTTSEKLIRIEGYETSCFKTESEYGYACLSTPE